MLAPTPTAPTPDTATVTPEGVVELIAAVTGIQDDVGDIIRPGAFRRTIAERRPKVCSNHRWDAPIGRVLDIKELLPGDPRLPRTTGDGRAWPRAAGALVATAQLNMSTKAGLEAFEIIRFFGPAESAFSIGYKVAPNGATHRGGIRYITNLDLYEISAVLHGANRYATLLSVKSAAPALETKATSGVLPAQRRAGMPVASPCSMCGRPAAAVAPGGLRAGESLICSRCVEVADNDTATAVLDADDIAAAYRLTEDELTSEEEYDAALDAEVEWHLESDGTLARGSRDPWDRNRRAAGPRTGYGSIIRAGELAAARLNAGPVEACLVRGSALRR